MRVERSERLKKLPPYLFAEIDRMEDEARAKGMDLITLGVGDPDLPTDDRIVQRLRKASQDPANHRYPAYEGSRQFREAAAAWFEKRFGVRLDPGAEVLGLIGSKEGIGHLPLAFVNPGDEVIVPDPGYPPYEHGVVFAGGVPVPMSLYEESGFLPDFEALDEWDLSRVKMLYLNYPSNPTAAVATKEVLSRAVEFAKDHDIMLVHDAAYSEIAFDGFVCPSLLEVEGAREVGIEFHSLSKTYNMTGWRIGFAVGNPEILAGLGKVKLSVDSGPFTAVQEAGIEALTGDQGIVKRMVEIYQARRDILVDGLNAIGMRTAKPKGSFYVWSRVPEGFTSKGFTEHILREVGVVVTPGNGFGSLGEGFVRMSLCLPEARLEETVERFRKALS